MDQDIMVRPTRGPTSPWALDRCEHCERVSVKIRSVSSDCQHGLGCIFLSDSPTSSSWTLPSCLCLTVSQTASLTKPSPCASVFTLHRHLATTVQNITTDDLHARRCGPRKSYLKLFIGVTLLPYIPASIYLSI